MRRTGREHHGRGSGHRVEDATGTMVDVSDARSEGGEGASLAPLVEPLAPHLRVWGQHGATQLGPYHAKGDGTPGLARGVDVVPRDRRGVVIDRGQERGVRSDRIVHLDRVRVKKFGARFLIDGTLWGARRKDDDGVASEGEDCSSGYRRYQCRREAERRVDDEGHEAEESPSHKGAVRARGEEALGVQGVQWVSARSSAL